MPRTTLYEAEIEALSVPMRNIGTQASREPLEMTESPSKGSGEPANARPQLTDIEKRYAKAYEAWRAAESEYERMEWADTMWELRQLMRAEWVTRGIITEEQFMRMR